MNKIKIVNKEKITLNGVKYKGYNVGDLPPTFAYRQKETETDEGVVIDFGTKDWFNHKGLTYIKHS